MKRISKRISRKKTSRKTSRSPSGRTSLSFGMTKDHSCKKGYILVDDRCYRNSFKYDKGYEKPYILTILDKKYYINDIPSILVKNKWIPIHKQEKKRNISNTKLLKDMKKISDLSGFLVKKSKKEKLSNKEKKLSEYLMQREIELIQHELEKTRKGHSSSHNVRPVVGPEHNTRDLAELMLRRRQAMGPEMGPHRQ